jgi:hypothetical protein
VAFAREDQDQVPGLSQLEGAAGNTLPDAANDFRFRLTSSPRGLLPIAHLCDADYRHWHGAGRYTLRAAAKAESLEMMLGQSFSMHALPLRSARLPP